MDRCTARVQGPAVSCTAAETEIDPSSIDGRPYARSFFQPRYERHGQCSGGMRAPPILGDNRTFISEPMVGSLNSKLNEMVPILTKIL